MSETLRIHFTDADFRHVQLANTPDPMWEAILAPHVLEIPASEVPLHLRAWRGRARRNLTGRPIKRALRLLADLAPPDASYFPDFLTPVEAVDGLEAGIDMLRSTPRKRLIHELQYASRTRTLPAWTRRLAAGDQKQVDEVADAIRLVHEQVITPDWSMIDATVSRDRLLRLDSLDGGVDSLLTSLSTFTWTPPVLSAPYPMTRDIHLQGRGVRFVPSYFCHGAPVAIVDKHLPPVVVFPLAHRMLTEATAGAHIEALKHLLGGNRAKVLDALRCPATTGRLAARIGISESAASGHVKVLRDAGLVDSVWGDGHKEHTLTVEGQIVLRLELPSR
ncbi:winged helix-turn-helix transcriptional regulator [Streptomyces sp. A7024]|uniref:Winged helix-turn-helix transcriptional regulator n=1 Tax=Streptomyces coryli TaxID=1128680 RepID=A0A6G4UA37_9ACTN|nr:winged helix-turn-helix domain-containing protein [Streptomyces coryli]NGN68177.1 winged helix-turn-helix transcriptional regulator [Streptomyces coryli]